MAFEAVVERIPDFAKDLKLNLTSLSRQTELTPQQFWGSVATAAITIGNSELLAALETDIREQLSDTAYGATKIAAALMGMNNIYYRFGHLASHENYLSLPSKLRMNSLRSHGVEQLDFELWCLVASALSGCGLCIDSHEKKIREEGMSEEAILTAIRIASVLNGISKALPT